MRIFIACLALIFSASISAFEHFSITRDWQTIEGQYSKVTYPKIREREAFYALASADNVLPQLSDYLSWAPSDKVEIVLSDQSSSANGYATPFPYNRSVLFLALPSGVSELQDYDNWLDLLILHEMTHIIHLDKTRDAASYPRYIFGRNIFSFPNIFLSTFLKEGLATYAETSLGKNVGRGQSAYYDMVMRTEVASDLLPLGKIQQSTRDWPINKSYSYGVKFYQFLESKYGADSIPRYVEATSGRLIPFLVDGPAKFATFSDGLKELWSEYLTWLEHEYSDTLEVRTANQTPFSSITDTGYINGSPYFSEDGSLYYIAFDPYGPSTLTVSKDGKIQSLVQTQSTAQIVHIDADHLFYIQPSPCGHHATSNALYVYDIELGKASQIKDCTGYNSATFLLINEKLTLAAVKSNGLTKSLVIAEFIDNKLENERTLYTSNSYENLATPLWKDSDTILLTRKPAAKPWQLVEYSLTSESLNIVLSEDNTNIFEIYAGPKAQNIILSSDKNGFIELWSYHLEAQSLNPLTISIGGASSGSYSAKTGQLAYRYYSDKGWDIVSTDYKELSPAIDVSKNSEKNPENNPTSGANQSPHSYRGLEFDTTSHQDREHTPPLQHDYNPLESIAPQSWFFGFSSDNTNTTGSIILNGRDALNFHNWALIAGRDFDNDLNVFSGAYTFYNHLTALYSRAYDYTEGSASGPPAFVEKARLIEDQEDSALLAHKTWRFDFSQLTLTGGVNNYQRTLEDQFTKNQQSIQVETLGLSAIYNDAIQALYGISPAHGRTIQFNIERDRRSINSGDQSYGNVWTIDWREYIALYGAHTLALRAFVGEAQTGADFFDLGDSPSITAFKQGLIHQREKPLRGYPDSAPELRGFKPSIYSADYRFPIAYVDQGIDAWPIGLHTISGALFYESGTPNRDISTFDAAGVELNVGLDLGYSALPVALRLGAAFPFDETSTAPDKDPNYYLGIGYSL